MPALSDVLAKILSDADHLAVSEAMHSALLELQVRESKLSAIKVDPARCDSPEVYRNTSNSDLVEYLQNRVAVQTGVFLSHDQVRSCLNNTLPAALHLGSSIER